MAVCYNVMAHLCYLDDRIELDIENVCWFYKSEHPIRTCTVHSLDWNIEWRRDNLLIALNGRPVGKDKNWYSTISFTNGTLRQERLYVSTKIAMSSHNKASKFRCENKGLNSPNHPLYIAGNVLLLCYYIKQLGDQS